MFTALGLLLLAWLAWIYWAMLSITEGVAWLKKKYVIFCSCPLPPNLPWHLCMSPCKWCDYITDWAFEKEDLGHPYRGRYERR